MQMGDNKMLELIEHLEALGNGAIDPEDLSEGICQEVKKRFGHHEMSHIKYFARLWPKYSGNEMYPVPCSVGGDPELRYIKSNDLWGNKYGDLRRELCLFVASKMRKLYV